MLRRRSVAVLGVLTLVAGAGAVQLVPGGAPAARASGLTTYDSCAALLTHYRAETVAGMTAYGFGFGFGAVLEDTRGIPAAAGAAESDARTSGPVGSGPTGTNLQEQGVDEPDMAKLRDGRLVVVARGALWVLSAEDQPRLLGQLRLGNDAGYGGELLLVGDRALVLVPGYRPDPLPGDSGTASDASRLAYFPGHPTTRLVLVDVSSDEPRLLEEATYDGQYVSARLVDGTVRLVTTSGPRLRLESPQIQAEGEALLANRRAARELTLAQVLPQVLRKGPDGDVLESGHAVTCERTTHARNPSGTSTLLVTTLRPAESLAATDSTGVTTDGDLVYASQERLYVATSRWGTVGPVRPLDVPGSGVASPVMPQDEVRTEVHAFDTSDSTSTRYVATGSVPGYVLGRWAFSEHEGNLRVATTRQPPWAGGEGEAESTSSMLLKLVERDGRLVETGRVEDLGKTETIRAVRYFGDIAAVVTFRQTDPLYLLDLSGTPKVLGELKVPGFSTYLHPIGDDLLLGLGHDADEEGRVTGMQASVFDVSDLSRPTLVDRLPIGQGYSPALEDSRAIAYDPQRRLAVIPYFAYDLGSGTAGAGGTALGISVDGQGRLREVGQLVGGDASSPAVRVMMDGERVYAIGDNAVIAGSAATLRRTGEISLGGE